MKRLILILIPLVSIFSIYQLKATCPAGYTSLVTSVYVQGCEYTIEVCFRCPSISASGDIRVVSWQNVNPSLCKPNLSATEIYATICDQVFDYTWIKNNICSSIDQVPPCEEGGFYMQYSYDRCWVKYNEGNGVFKYYPCSPGNCLCIEVWKWCWSPLPPPMGSIVKVLSEGPYKSCNYECPDSEPADQQVPYHQESSCFHLGTPCDPW